MSFRLGRVARLKGIEPCRGKQKHWSVKAAMRHFDHIVHNQPPAHRVGLNVYRCRYCNAFHLGRRKVYPEGRRPAA